MVYYMFPLITGRMYSEKLANIHFIGMLWGSVQVFYTQHLLGLEGMPRRIYDYPAEYTSWTQLNQIATIGAWILGASFVAFLINLIYYSAKGKEANMDDPFGLGGKYWFLVFSVAHINILRGGGSWLGVDSNTCRLGQMGHPCLLLYPLLSSKSS